MKEGPEGIRGEGKIGRPVGWKGGREVKPRERGLVPPIDVIEAALHM